MAISPSQTISTVPRVICPRVIHPNENRRGGHSCATLSSKMRRGGACVPARTSAQRRFHAKNIRIVCGELNDGCALAGRHGRAHRHRPYQSPSYFPRNPIQTKFRPCAIHPKRNQPSTRNPPPTKSTTHMQSAPTNPH